MFLTAADSYSSDTWTAVFLSTLGTEQKGQLSDSSR